MIPRGIWSYEFAYFIISDSYIIKDVKNNKVLQKKKNWHEGIESMEGEIFMKKEDDWKMVYLTRSPESTSAKVTWSFELEDTANMCIASVNLRAITETFNGASIKWEIKGINLKEDVCKVVEINNSKNVEINDLNGAIRISVNATLSGGKGDMAWQHAQLFRQSLNVNSSEPSLLIKINLHDK